MVDSGDCWNRIILVAILFIFCFFAWRRAAGTLSLTKLNLFSAMFYYVMIFAFVGGSSVFCGYRDHYMIQKVSEKYVDVTYYMLVWSIILLPVVICSVNFLMGKFDYKKFYKGYISSPVVCEKKDSSVFVWCISLTAVAIVAVTYVFWMIGYVPLFKIFVGGIDFARERIIIGREFVGNQYVRNFFALSLVPLLSFLSYTYYRTTKQLKWKLLFYIHFITAILCKTYNFEKAPLAIYLSYLCLIEILIGKKISLRKMITITATAFCTIIGFYFALAEDPSLNHILESILKRIFVSQIGTLFLHIETFPDLNDFLCGASFPQSIGFLFGGGDWGIRSGRVVMEIFGAGGMANGTAGVMNTLYIGEAWANYGMLGLIVAPVVVGIIVSVASNFVLELRKDSVNITLYVILTMHYLQAIVGGFVDFIYSPSLIFDFIVLMGIKKVKFTKI